MSEINRKLIVFDIDGTLVSYQKETNIPCETKMAIRRLKENGHTIALATSRCLCLARAIMVELAIEHAVLHNGAQIILAGENVYEKKMGVRISKRICKTLIDTPLCVFAFDGEFVYTQNMSDESRKYIMAQALNTDIIKPLRENKGALLALNIYGEITQLAKVFAAIPSIDFKQNQFEITAKGISKGRGLKRLAKMLNIEIKNTIAVGDGLNDIDMIKAAGIGIAVGGAREELKVAADMITDGIEQGGILKAFVKLSLI